MHAAQLLDALALMRINETLCDVLLQSEVEGAVAEAADETASEAHGVWAHRVVLAASSPYFLAMFTNFSERKETVITIKGTEPAALQAVVEYIYSPESLLVTADNAQMLLTAASLLAVDGLRNKVCSFMEGALTADNALGILTFAKQHACDALAATTAQFIQDHSKEVFEADEMLRLSADELIELVDSLRQETAEEYVLDAVLRWTQHLLQERQQHLCELLQHVRLPLLSREMLAERSLAEPLLSAEPGAKNLIIKALAFHCQAADRRALDVAGNVWYRQRQSRTPSSLLVMGGKTTRPVSEVWCYDMSTGLWSAAAALPEARCDAGAAAIDGRVYVIGGQHGREILGSVAVYDVATGVWTAGPQLCSRRTKLGVAALGGVLYAVGGESPDHAGRAHTSAEKLDPREGVWRPIEGMSIARHGVGVAALGGLLYAAGGSNGYHYLDTVERYDPAAGRWESVERMAVRRCNAGVGVVDDALYIVGGYSGAATLSSVERYRAGSGWQFAPSLAAPAWELTVTTQDSRLFAVGGRSTLGDRLSTVAVLEPATAGWSELPAAMPAGRSQVTAVVIDCLPPAIP